LSWSEPADDLGVVDYRLSRDGVVIAWQTDTSYVDMGLEKNRAYGYELVARDAALNESQPVSIIVETTIPVDVPSIIGLSQAEAEAALVSAELVVGTVTFATSDAVPIGAVLDQTPASGVTIASGSAIDLVVVDSAPVAVPSVVGLPQDEAEAAIEDAGLTVGSVIFVSSNDVPVGDVSGESPPAGQLVAPGVAVDLVVVDSVVTQATGGDGGGGGGGSTGWLTLLALLGSLSWQRRRNAFASDASPGAEAR
jgi:MYXO-CTERM domain-containing protein